MLPAVLGAVAAFSGIVKPIANLFNDPRAGIRRHGKLKWVPVVARLRQELGLSREHIRKIMAAQFGESFEPGTRGDRYGVNQAFVGEGHQYTGGPAVWQPGYIPPRFKAAGMTILPWGDR